MIQPARNIHGVLYNVKIMRVNGSVITIDNASSVTSTEKLIMVHFAEGSKVYNIDTIDNIAIEKIYGEAPLDISIK